MRARLGDSVSGRHRPDENTLLTKHVVAAGTFAKDAGSTPAASTISLCILCIGSASQLHDFQADDDDQPLLAFVEREKVTQFEFQRARYVQDIQRAGAKGGRILFSKFG